jgi:hypothetical protein
MFRAWMHWADPPFVTGLEDDPDALRIWHQIYEHFGGAKSSDIEFLFVAHIMVSLAPWALGDEAEWVSNATALEQRLQTSDSACLSSRVFEARGEYGEYFAHQLRSMPSSTSLQRTHER